MIRSEHEEIECFPLVLNARTFDELFEHNKSKIDCNDIQSGYFEYSEIRFGRASDYSEECFRRWDTRFRVENTHIITLTQPSGPQTRHHQEDVLYSRPCPVTNKFSIRFRSTESNALANCKSTPSIIAAWMRSSLRCNDVKARDL